jgi:hypothetical protein
MHWSLQNRGFEAELLQLCEPKSLHLNPVMIYNAEAQPRPANMSLPQEPHPAGSL